MADVTLNLIYNDNGAQRNVDNLVRTLQGLETKRYSINVDSKEVQNVAKEAQKLVDELDQLKNRAVSINNAFDGRTIKATFNDLELVAGKFERRISDARQALINFYTTQAAKKNLGLLDDADDSKKLTQLKNNIKLAEEEAKIARSAFENLGKTLDVSGLTGSIDKIAQKMSSIGTGIYPENIRSMGDFTSDMTGRISSKFSKMRSSASERWRSQFGYYRQERFAEVRAAEDANEQIKKSYEELAVRINKANNDISQGHHQTWRGIQQTVTGVINTIMSAYSTIKSVMEAPLNLTGVSTFASMIESMKGSLLLGQVSSNITTGFSMGMERFDILQTFPKVMASIGYSTEQSSKAMDRLYQSVLGLPTAFSDIVDSAKYFALVLDDLDKATDLAIAANNAFVASGANSQQISAGMRQLQYLIDGTKLRSTQWYSLIRAMPIALREVGTALGYPDFSSFTADLMSSKIATEDLIDGLIDVGLHSEKLGSIIDVMKNRVTSAMDNVRNAAMRMGDAWLEALDESLQRTGGKGIAENIKGVSKIIDHIASVGVQWISQNVDKIQRLIDKFMEIDWARIIPDLFSGLVEFASNAVDNIDKFLDKIPKLLSTTKQFFNDLENSPLIKLLTGSISTTGGLTQVGAGIANIVAGTRLAHLGKSMLGGVGGASSISGSFAEVFGFSASTIGSVGVVTGAAGVLAAVVDLLYQIADKGLSDGLKTTAEHWSAFSNIWRSVNVNQNSLSLFFNDFAKLLKSANDSGAISEYRRSNLYSSHLSDILGRYSDYGFADDERKRSLSNVIDYITRFGYNPNNINNYGNVLNSYISRAISDMNLIDFIDKYYDEAINSFEKKKEEILNRIDSINEELAKQFAGVDINTYQFYKKIYDNGKKFFSEQVEESSGWGYSNTTKDRADFLEKNMPVVTGLLDEITQYALDNYADDEGVLAVVAQFMADFNWNDPEQLALLVKNYGGKSMQEIFQLYFEEQARNLNLDEAIQTALLNNQKKLAEGELAGINIEQERLENERESILAPYIEQLNDDLDELTEDFDDVLKTVENEGRKLIDSLNKIFDNLNTDRAERSINSFFGSILNKIRTWIELIRSTLSTSERPTFSGNYGSEGYYSATGGFMFAPRGTDTIPAMLTPGEYVQRRAAVQHFGRVFMDRINALDLNGALNSLRISTPYATGGIVKTDNRSYRDNHAVVNQVFNNSSANFGFRRANRYVRALG